MTSPPIPVRACVFDAYGTLLDFASAAEGCRDELGDQTDRLTRLWRDKQLQYTWLRAIQNKYVDFWQVTQDSLDFSLQALGLDDHELRTRLLHLYRDLDCYADAVTTLETLKTAGFITAILSNGSADMLKQSLKHAHIAHLIGQVFSADEVGVFKTDARVYQLAVDRLALAPEEMAFVSANGWDAHAAAQFGMRAFWINRTGQPPERLPGAPAAELASLTELADHIALTGA